MDNKFNNMLQEFLKDKSLDNIDELNKEIKKFIEKYNNQEIKYENTPLDDAYEILEKASQAKTLKQAIKLAQEAYKTSPECFDAILFQVDLEPNSLKAEKLLNNGLESEKNRLTKENLFDKENIGKFYLIFETRPYIRGLYMKATNAAQEGKYKLTENTCKEILELNENDNLGARYLLMAIYSLLEDEKSMTNLYNKYKEESLEMMMPFMILYYKQCNYKKAQEYLDKINKINPNLKKFYNETIEINDKVPDGFYGFGDSSEVFMYMECYDFLMDTVPQIQDFILNNEKNSE